MPKRFKATPIAGGLQWFFREYHLKIVDVAEAMNRPQRTVGSWLTRGTSDIQVLNQLEDFYGACRGDILSHSLDDTGRPLVQRPTRIEDVILNLDLLPHFRKILLENYQSLERQTNEARAARGPNISAAS